MGPEVKEDRYYGGQVQDQGLEIKKPKSEIKGLHMGPEQTRTKKK